jgi:hypothetical protein
MEIVLSIPQPNCERNALTPAIIFYQNIFSDKDESNHIFQNGHQSAGNIHPGDGRLHILHPAAPPIGGKQQSYHQC